MHEHFYNVAYIVNENGLQRSDGSCLLRTSKVPGLDAVRNHIRKNFLKDASAVITITQVESISKEVYQMLGGDPEAPLLKGEVW
jgi:hypothetical protein